MNNFLAHPRYWSQTCNGSITSPESRPRLRANWFGDQQCRVADWHEVDDALVLVQIERHGVTTDEACLSVPCPISYSRLHGVFLFLVPSASCKSLLPSVEKSSGVAHS